MCSAIIVAAGNSRRMGFNKLLVPLLGQPVIRHTVAAFACCDAVSEIIVVGNADIATAVERLPKVKAVIPGGVERHHSVWAGLQQLDSAATLVAVHDGGRPLISVQQIEKCVQAAAKLDAVACARPATETLKSCDAQGRIIGSVDRSHTWIMETPQVFKRNLLEDAYRQVLAQGLLVTDEVSALQHLGVSVQTVLNEQPNLKVTYPADLILAEKLLSSTQHV
jgi:2-C-methyl-D-erythritol 4-phosphate cytidylyltransferase